MIFNNNDINKSYMPSFFKQNYPSRKKNKEIKVKDNNIEGICEVYQIYEIQCG